MNSIPPVLIVFLLHLLTTFGRSVTHRTENITYSRGPRPNETGRFIYTTEGSRETLYCRFCSSRAVSDQTYIYEQQSLCYRVYKETSFDEHLTQYEKSSEKIAVCNVGEIPGCRSAPYSVTSAAWHCLDGYEKPENGSIFPVYVTCQLSCLYGPDILAQAYCNESLEWTVDYHHNKTCPAEHPSVHKDSGVDSSAGPVSKEDEGILVWIVIVVGVIVVGGLVTVVICCWICKRKRSPSQQSSEENIPMNPINGNLVTNGNPSFIRRLASCTTIGDCSLSESVFEVRRESGYNPSSGNENDDETSDESEILIPSPPAETTSRHDSDSSEQKSKSPGTSFNYAKVENCDSQNPAIPSVKVFHMNSSNSGLGNSGSACIQKNAYSVPQGSVFYIVPSSPGGVVIARFEVVRKGDGPPYRGQAAPELGLHFFHTVERALPSDAGTYTWHITLENGSHYKRDFILFISKGNDEQTLTNQEEETTSLPSQSDKSNLHCGDVVEKIVDFTSGEKPQLVMSRPQPEGQEAEAQVRSTASKPSGFQNPAPPPPPVPVQQQIFQKACPVSPNSLPQNSLPHFNIMSSSIGNSQQPLVSGDSVGQSVARCLDNAGDEQGAAQQVQGERKVSNIDGEHAVSSDNNQRLRAELTDTSTVSHCGENENEPPSDADITLPHLNPGSISCTSNSREGPSGASHNPIHVEHPRAEQMISGFESDSLAAEDDLDQIVHQTHRKQVAGDPEIQCITSLCDVTDQQYLDRLCNLADPRDQFGYSRSWFGFGMHYGIEEWKLRAIEYHRRGFVHDGPMRYLIRELGEKGKKLSDLIRYFLNNNRRDIVDLTLHNCANHEQCHYCREMCRQH